MKVNVPKSFCPKTILGRVYLKCALRVLNGTKNQKEPVLEPAKRGAIYEFIQARYFPPILGDEEERDEIELCPYDDSYGRRFPWGFGRYGKDEFFSNLKQLEKIYRKDPLLLGQRPKDELLEELYVFSFRSLPSPINLRFYDWQSGPIPTFTLKEARFDLGFCIAWYCQGYLYIPAKIQRAEIGPVAIFLDKLWQEWLKYHLPWRPAGREMDD